MIIETDKTKFDQQIQSPSIVDFYTTGCPSCEKLGPVFEQLSGQYSTYSFLKVNLDADITLAERYGISHVPTVIRFEYGQPAGIRTGYMDETELAEFITDGEDAVQ